MYNWKKFILSSSGRANKFKMHAPYMSKVPDKENKKSHRTKNKP